MKTLLIIIPMALAIPVILTSIACAKGRLSINIYALIMSIIIGILIVTDALDGYIFDSVDQTTQNIIPYDAINNDTGKTGH